MAFFGRSAPPTRLEELRKLLSREPSSRQFLALAEEQRKAGEFAEAIRTLEVGLRHHPTYAAAHVALGRICRESGRTDEALRAFQDALKVDRDNLVAIKQIGSLYLERGEKVEAVKKFKLYRGLNPGDKDVAELIDRLDGELGTTTRLRPMPMVAAPPRPRPASLPIPSRALQPEPFRLSYAVPLSPPYAPREGAASPDFQRPVEEMAGPPLSAVVAARFATRQVEVAEEQAVWQVGPIDQPLVTPSPSGGRGGIPPEPDAFLEMTYDAPAARREVPKSALPPEPPPPEEVFRFDFDLSEAEGASAPPPLPTAPLVAAAKSEAAAEAEAERDTLPGVPIPPRPAEVDRPPNVEASWASFDAGATVAIGPPAAGREEIVTETLAELYVAQGLIPEARDAYFALARVDVDPQRAARLREKAERLAAPLPPPARDPRAVRLREWAARVERKEPGGDGDLQGVVAGLVASGNGIDFAIVTETEGVPVVTSGPFGAVEEGLAAELADFWKTLQRGRDDVGAGDAKLVSLAARDGGIVIAPVGPGYALIVRSSASAPPGLVRWETARAASRLRPLLA